MRSHSTTQAIRSGRSTCLETALTRQPNDRELLSVLALYAAKAGQREAALGYAKRLVALDPKTPTTPARRAHRRAHRKLSYVWVQCEKSRRSLAMRVAMRTSTLERALIID
jgi:hypothetical protein